MLGLLTWLYSVAVTGGCVLFGESTGNSARIDLGRGREFTSALLYLIGGYISESVSNIRLCSGRT